MMGASLWLIWLLVIVFTVPAIVVGILLCIAWLREWSKDLNQTMEDQANRNAEAGGRMKWVEGKGWRRKETDQ